MIDIAKDVNGAISAVNNNKSMVSEFTNHTEAKEFINNSKVDVDYIISDILGLMDDYIFISSSISKRDKAKIFSVYRDAYSKIQKDMYTVPTRPIAGQTFEQDRNTSEYFFFMEKLNVMTFSVMFSIYQIHLSKTRELMREI